MNRSLFVKLFLSLPFSVELLTGWRDRYDKPTFLLNKFFVAGFQHYMGPEIISSIQSGENLMLVIESDNSFDRFAVAIFRGSKKLGYVPRTDNAEKLLIY